MFLLNHLWTLCVVFISSGTSLPEKLFGRAFAVIWNAPSEVCEKHYGIRLNVDQYNIIQNKNDHFEGDKMVLFYEKQLGLYPHILPNGTLVNGGIPQLMNLKEHLNQAIHDVKKIIPSKNFIGPAVIDWENWRPLYERNFGSKRIYRRLAMSHVQKQYPIWNKENINHEAEIQFDNAARELIMATLNMGKGLRSGARWGFYGFPRIYEKIPVETRIANDRLGWLFSSSTGLYPSIYLHSKNDAWLKQFNFVVNTLNETFRIYDKFNLKNETFVVPYARFRYEHPEEFYTKPELVLSLTIPAATGSAGAILWDSSHSFRDRKHCELMKSYLTTTLGPFVKNLTSTFQSCSEHLCHGNGRCVKSWQTIGDSKTWLNAKKEVNSFAQIKDVFVCKCYTEWTGKHCESRRR